MKNLSLSALAAVGVLAGMTAANAADLGGNCCADLEERIAELEATTARKGNRKVSLTISGWVSQQVSVWDDGTRTKAYVSDIGATLSTNVKFTGQAKINPEWTAGYVLHIETYGSDPLLHTNNNVTQQSNGAVNPLNPSSVGVLQSFWFLKSESLGKLSIGKQSSAADNAAILPDGSGSLVPANYVFFDNNAMFARRSNGALTGVNWGGLANCATTTQANAGLAADCDGVPNNNIRYDTPVFGGFSASASWGESDIWAVAGRYAGEIGEFKLAAAVAYTESTDNLGQFGVVLAPALRVKAADLQVGAYLQHVPTGLFVYGAYGRDYNNIAGMTDGDNYYLKAGIRQKWTPLGATVLFGEYGNNSNKQGLLNFNAGISGSNVDQWGLGIVQEIDAAAMSLWFVYRDYSGSANCTSAAALGCAGAGGLGLALGNNSFQDWQVFKAGGLISF